MAIEPKVKIDTTNMKEFICVNDQEFNCGTVTPIVFCNQEIWVHTGWPNAIDMTGKHFCGWDGATRILAEPSTMEVVK